MRRGSATPSAANCGRGPALASAWLDRSDASARGGSRLVAGNLRVSPGNDAPGIAGSGAPRDLAPPDKQHQCRNAMDIVAGRDPRLFLGIELQQAKPRFEFGGGALVSRRHGTARPAPRSPEIDES